MAGDALQVLFEQVLYFAFSSNRILIEQRAKAGNVERQLLLRFIRQKDRWLIQTMRVAELVVDVRIVWRDIGDDDRRFLNTLRDLLNDQAAGVDVVCPDSFVIKIFTYGPDHLLIERVVRLLKLHDDKCSRPFGFDGNVFYFNGRVALQIKCELHSADLNLDLG